MTFDNVKEMQIGSKKVKEAWLNGMQVYPSAKRIMDSLVCWYDIGKQQCTNESMAANPVLADLSGNGHDIECFNFGWSGMSGIGGYKENFTDSSTFYKWSDRNIFTVYENYIHITEVNNHFNFFIRKKKEGETNIESTRIKINGISGSGCKLVINYSTTVLLLIEEDDEYTIPALAQLDEDYAYGWGIRFGETSTQGECNITIELLPEYPNALVSDGVDDYCYTKGLPILTDYTVIAKRKWLQTEGSNNDCFAAKGNNLASFLIERYGNDGSQECYSFGQYNGVNFAFQEDVIYQTKESYNGSPLKVGTAVDVDNLVILARTSAPMGCIQAALYSFLLFDRTLTTAEIEWVKKNMIEGGGVENGLE